VAHITLPEGAPGIIGPMAAYPETEKPLNALAEVLLRGPSSLTSAERETIAAYVSAGNECRFCCQSHAAAARAHYGEHGMATKEQLRAMITAKPFRPFVIKMASGERFTIRHPENAACDRDGRSLTVYDDEMHLVQMLLVEVMEPESAAEIGPGAIGP
jgi:AhpD family alkylhydroperoxidase